jgi:hypothetical protein
MNTIGLGEGGGGMWKTCKKLDRREEIKLLEPRDVVVVKEGIAEWQMKCTNS